jgi:glycosyltransferase involved in cell wall biosynthesis
MRERNVEICFITKYPPIQGGVSMHCYWAARGLAERGHRVFVVTNADEVEETFRIGLSESERAPGGECQLRFPDSGGQVDVLSTRPPDRRRLYYIPMGNPTVTRLATMATDAIRANDCRVIFSYYLEPYGVAAYLASRWTRVPYVFKHAGSDLHRLMELDELRTTYTEVLVAANRVISRGPSRKLLLDAGVREDRITDRAGFSLPAEFFNPEASARPLPWWLKDRVGGTPPHLDPDIPVLGVYGKLGEYKGSADLVQAMARLHNEGFRFHLLAASHGWQEMRYRELVAHLGLTDYVHLIPFVPHWRVPSFIRSCTAVAFLEREFPISAHTPTIPLEVITCGGCLVVSAEVARKQLFRAQIRDLRNVVVVPDPREHELLAERLQYALQDDARARRIGRRGYQEFGYRHSYGDYVAELEDLLTTVAKEPATEPEPPPRRPSANAITRGPTDVVDATERFYPYTRALLDDMAVRRIRQAVAGRSVGSGARDAQSLGLELGRALLSALPDDGSPVRDVCRYEYKVLEWGSGRTAPNPAETPSNAGTWNSSHAASPRLAGEFEIIRFSRDVEPILEAIERGDDEPEAAGADGGVRVLFHRGSPPLRVSEATEWLLELLRAGSLTIADIESQVRERFRPADPDSAADLIGQCVDTLEGLFWEGVVAVD